LPFVLFLAIVRTDSKFIAAPSGVIAPLMTPLPTLQEVLMPASNVLILSENVGTMTFAEGQAFIERTRRQLDRFDDLPRAEGQAIASEDAERIRRLCDELEADIKASLSDT
jgi:pentose-5-phosphate-3-epimerase